jgi:hypothetical protein
MKKLLPFLSIALAFVACHNANNSPANSQSKTDSIAKIGKMSNFTSPGDSLNLSNTVVSPTVAATYTAAAQNKIVISSQNPNNGGESQTLPLPGQFQIPFVFTDSINKVTRLLNRPNGSYISAVEILFGLGVAPGDVYTSYLFFKPLIIPGTVVSNVGTYTCPAADTNGFYVLNPSGTFSTIPYSTISADTSNFRQYTWYIPCPKCPSTAWQPFNTATNSNGSTRCIIYPIQELAAMFGSSRSGSINIDYICRKYDTSDSIKLDLMLNITTNSMTTTTNNDMSHLVPPATTLTYTVIPKSNK